MNIAIAIFAKNPQLSPAKTRLAATIGQAAANQFYQLCLNNIAASVQTWVNNSAFHVSPYWALAEEASLALPAWQYFTPIWTGDGGLGERMQTVYQQLMANHDAVLLIGSDVPLLDNTLLEQAALQLVQQNNRLVLGPAEDGGFYLCGGCIPIPASAWTNTPYSCTDTLAQFCQHLTKANIHTHLLTPLLDVDTEADLRRLQQVIRNMILPSALLLPMLQI